VKLKISIKQFNVTEMQNKCLTATDSFVSFTTNLALSTTDEGYLVF